MKIHANITDKYEVLYSHERMHVRDRLQCIAIADILAYNWCRLEYFQPSCFFHSIDIRWPHIDNTPF